VHRGVLAGLLIPCFVAGACGGASDGAGSLSGHTPPQVLNLATRAMAAQKSSFHFVDESRVGSQIIYLRGYDTGSGAEQLVSGAAPELEVERTAAGRLFVRGEAAALEDSLNLSKATAALYTNRWISLQRTDSPYASVASALEPRQEINSYLPVANLTLHGPLQFHGHSVLAVRGAAGAAVAKGTAHTATIYVAAQSPHTAVGATLTFGSGAGQGMEAAVFTEWGKQDSPAAPTASVAYSTVNS
jgi:hypothetical protein